MGYGQIIGNPPSPTMQMGMSLREIIHCGPVLHGYRQITTLPLAVSGSTYNFTGYRIIISWILVNTTDVPTDGSNIVKGYSLSQNYPNPFNPSTTFRYSIPNESKVIIKVYDILGKEIETLVNEEKPTGTYEITWIC